MNSKKKNCLKCDLCNRRYYSQIEGKNTCKTHFYELYFKTRDEACIKAELGSYGEHLHEGETLHASTKDLLKEIKKRHPHLAQEYPLLFY